MQLSSESGDIAIQRLQKFLRGCGCADIPLLSSSIQRLADSYFEQTLDERQPARCGFFFVDRFF